jgi:hypothetical protein
LGGGGGGVAWSALAFLVDLPLGRGGGGVAWSALAFLVDLPLHGVEHADDKEDFRGVRG